jgi:hypothetical protein
MKLEDKGPIIEAPTLKGPAQKVSKKIQSWPDVISATHWTIGDSTKSNGADFYVGESELGHIHLDGELHLVVTKQLRKALIDANLAEPFPWGNDWVQLKIKDEKTAEQAAWLFRLAYDRLKGATDADLKLRISQQTR